MIRSGEKHYRQGYPVKIGHSRAENFKGDAGGRD